MSDYVVDEIRRIREEQAAQYGFDIQTILAAAQKRQRRSGFKVVSFAAKARRSTKVSIRRPKKRTARNT